jgi:HEAT repeat protein
MADFDPIIFQALKSSNPEERKKAVIALGRTKDREAWRYLATIYKNDPDQMVRDLALQAGKYIKHMDVQAEWTGDH